MLDDTLLFALDGAVFTIFSPTIAAIIFHQIYQHSCRMRARAYIKM